MLRMKKNTIVFLLLCLIIAKTSFEGKCQVIDTTCVPTAQLKKILSDARQKPVLLERIEILKADIAYLNSRVAVKDSIINLYDLSDLQSKEIISQLKEEKRIYEEEIAIYKKDLVQFEKMLRKEKRKRRWAAFGGLTLTGIVTYLYISK